MDNVCPYFRRLYGGELKMLMKTSSVWKVIIGKPHRNRTDFVFYCIFFYQSSNHKNNKFILKPRNVEFCDKEEVLSFTDFLFIKIVCFKIFSDWILLGLYLLASFHSSTTSARTVKKIFWGYFWVEKLRRRKR